MTEILGRAGVGAFLVGAALGSFVYRIGLELVLASDLVVREAAFARAGTRDLALRYGPWVALAVGIVVLVGGSRVRAGRRVVAGSALLGGGIAFFALGSADMHGLGLYDWRGGLPAGLLDALYHGVGVAVAVVGYALVLAPAGAGTPRSPDRPSQGRE